MTSREFAEEVLSHLAVPPRAMALGPFGMLLLSAAVEAVVDLLAARCLGGGPAGADPGALADPGLVGRLYLSRAVTRAFRRHAPRLRDDYGGPVYMAFLKAAAARGPGGMRAAAAAFRPGKEGKV